MAEEPLQTVEEFTVKLTEPDITTVAITEAPTQPLAVPVKV